MSKKSVIIYFNYYLSNERSYYLSMLSHLMNLISILIRCMYWKLFSIYEQTFRWTRQSTLWKSNWISSVCATILHNRPFILKCSRIRWDRKSIFLKIQNIEEKKESEQYEILILQKEKWWNYFVRFISEMKTVEVEWNTSADIWNRQYL